MINVGDGAEAAGTIKVELVVTQLVADPESLDYGSHDGR